MLQRVAQHYVGIQDGTEAKYRILNNVPIPHRAI